ncbi:hypothetical protein [Staphylococcus sp. Marseille-Q6910]|uniref:hypothetical protein n=1 Tax=Staphylococcus sp. Marseille-Q6910 TaxID=2937990 RepID=UPI00203E209D|nr:hypothetical protein [Staphylococcus sp. Marseille-Q6910]
MEFMYRNDYVKLKETTDLFGGEVISLFINNEFIGAIDKMLDNQMETIANSIKSETFDFDSLDIYV